MSFGFFADKPILIDQASVFMTNLAMERGKDSLVQFLSRLGPVEEEAAPVAVISPSKPVDAVDFIGTSSGQEVHEIVFGVISHNAISGRRVTDADSKLDMLGVLLLRCQKETLRHFLLALYAA